MSNRLASSAVAGLEIGGVLLSAACSGHHQGTVNGAESRPVGGTSTPSATGPIGPPAVRASELGEIVS